MTIHDVARVRGLVRRICINHEQIRRDQRELDDLMIDLCGYPRLTLERTRNQLDQLLTSLTDDDERGELPEPGA
jgi:hypothetical protein